MRDETAVLERPAYLDRRPGALQVEITSFCNLKCKMCPLTIGATLSSVTAAHMVDAVWSEVVVAAKEAGRVIMTGFGENTTNPRFVELLRELDEAGVRLSFTTNAISMRKELVEKLAGLKCLEHINVSIDSPDPDVYREVRGGDVHKALRGLENMIAGLPPHVDITVSSVAMGSNIESLVAFPDLLAKMGVKIYVLQGLHDRTEELGEDDVRANPRATEFVEAIKRRCGEVGITLELVTGERLDLEARDPEAARRLYHGDGEFHEQKTRQCLAPWMSPFIDREGRVFACCHGSGSDAMGNLNQNTFGEIWDSTTFRGFRDALVTGKDLAPVCKSCALVKIGPHPRRFSGAVEHHNSNISGHQGLYLKVRNTGLEAWSSRFPLAIGVLADKSTPLHHPSWASNNRIGYMEESVVEPGGCATFRFQIAPPTDAPIGESFKLVVEGLFWLDDTEFSLWSRPPEPTLRADGPVSRLYRPLLRRAYRGIRRRAKLVKDWAIPR